MPATCSFCAISLAALVSFTFPLSAALPQGKIQWTASIDDALIQAQAENRVLFISMGFSGEARSESIRKSAFSNKGLSLQSAITINVPAWTFEPSKERKFAKFGDAEILDHHQNLVECLDRWLEPNNEEAIAWPHHLWIAPNGNLLLSCPWELSAEEFSWCFNEAFRRAKIENPPKMISDAHPPRRLLLGEVFKLPPDDIYGRGLLENELEEMMVSKKKRYLSWADAADIAQIIFTDSQNGVEYIHRQIGTWEMGGSRTGPIVNGTLGTIGNLSTPVFFELLENFAERSSATTRSQVAVAYEQIGSSKAASKVKKWLKKEKEPRARAEWVRALGACGRGDKSIARSLIKLAEKDKDPRVRINAILALSHVLPEASARTFLIDLAEIETNRKQLAAVLAIGFARDHQSRTVLEKLKKGVPHQALLAHLDAALAVLDGANLYTLEDLFRGLDESPFDRKRIFFRGTFRIFDPNDAEESDEDSDADESEPTEDD